MTGCRKLLPSAARRLSVCTVAVLCVAAADNTTVTGSVAAASHGHLPTGLSSPGGVTRWAHAVTRAPARLNPVTRSHEVAHLRLNTEDNLPEVYVVLESRVGAEGKTWIKVRIPMRPRARRGWVRRDALGALHVVDTRLRINRQTLRATLYRRGRRIWRSPIGVGKLTTPTPAGRFYIRELIRVTESNTIYGPLAFGTSAYSKLTDWPGGGIVGIHGTNKPWLIPGRPSHGCIRLPNRKIERLAQLMPLGTPVRIV